ncbi:TonB-dependent receptor [Rhizorhabdus sp. FW153]|uniref:TonB-dependent receptor n=1 Tax=Rhizorhabdus sp. FW153 TaxID=3400216 RepID=UPI003CF7DC63
MTRSILLATLLMGGTSQTALAQTTAALPEQDRTKDEIIVTGTRQPSPLADTPVAATVLTEQFVEDARIETVRDIDDYVPNVQFNQLGQIGATFITIRGIESNPFIVNRAAVYVDGIPFRDVQDQALGFIEQVEVLRGPQGTLYGANTESGLIVIRTRQPSDRLEVDAALTGTVFGNGQGYEARLAVSGPLTNTLAGSFVATHDGADSFVQNRASSIGEPGYVTNTFVQGKLRYKPTDRLTVDLLGYYFRQRAPGLYEQEFLPIDREAYDANYSAGFNGGRRSGRYDLINDAPKRTAQDEYVLAGNLNYTFSGAVLDVNASWRKEEETAFGSDIDLTALPAIAGGDADDNRYLNFEARLSSPQSNRVQWVFGVSHYNERQQQILATLAGPGGLDDFNPAPPQRSRARDYAAFGSVTVPLGDRLRLTGGLRYDYAERELRQAAGVLSLGPAGQFVFAAEDLKDDFDALLPRVSVDWKPMENLLVYASAARGWVPGGFNLAATAVSVTEDFTSYDPETLWTYEAGAKLTFLDGRALLAGAVFHTEADNWQEFNVLVNAAGQAVSTNLITSNAEIRSRGFELELTAKVNPTLDLAASFGYVDSVYNDYRFSAVQDFTGNRVRLVPEFDASVSASWRPWRGLFLRGEANGVGNTQLNPENTAQQDSYLLLNAQIGWQEKGWDLRLFVDNITDQRVFTTSAYSNFAFGFDGTLYAGVGAPRVVGLRVGRRW